MTWEKGQPVVISDVNFGTSEGTVVKVGRTLVHVAAKNGVVKTFRKDDGSANDQWGHQWILTREQYTERQARAAVRQRLSAVGARIDGKYSTETLSKVADLLESETP